MRILYLDLDTLRPDHLGCYGYQRDTSPNLDRIACEGVTFENCYCADAPCLPSRTSLMTGEFGIRHGCINHGGTNADQRPEGPARGFRDRLAFESLPGALRRGGFHRALISPFADRHSSWPFLAGFNEIHDPGQKGGLESAEEVTPTVLDWIEHNGAGDGWFLHVNYWDAHTPYRAPASFGNPFFEDPIPEWLTPDVFEAHRKLAGPHTALDISMYSGDENPRFPRQPGALHTPEDLRRLIDGYDSGIRYMDGHVGQILEALEARGVLEDTAVIVSADHGENFGELGIYAEHGTADQATCRIPLIVRWPGGPRGARNAGLRYNLDMAPTLADMVGVPPGARWAGRSFAPVLRGDEDAGWNALVLSQCCHGAQRSVRFGDMLFMRTYHDGFHPHFERDMLFDLAADPHEQHNLAATRPDLVREAIYLLDAWHDEQMAGSPSDVDPLRTVLREGPFHASGQLARYVARLEATGRGEWIPELKRRHPEEFSGR